MRTLSLCVAMPPRHGERGPMRRIDAPARSRSGSEASDRRLLLDRGQGPEASDGGLLRARRQVPELRTVGSYVMVAISEASDGRLVRDRGQVPELRTVGSYVMGRDIR